MDIKRFAKAAAIAASFAAAAGCTQNLGEGYLHGNSVQEDIFGAGVKTNHLFLDGDHLKSGKEYAYEGGSVTIEGDIAPGVTLTVRSGKLTVLGNVGDNAKITAYLPHTQEMV